jgi:hypothetical protein
MSNSSNTLQKGIYLENLDITIPWNEPLSKIELYGNPQLENAHTEIKKIIWKEVQILGGLHLNLSTYFSKSVLSQPLFNHVRADMSEREFDTIRLHLLNYFKTEGLLYKKSETDYSYQWTIDNIEITLGAGDRFGAFYYLQINPKEAADKYFLFKYWLITLLTAPLVFAITSYFLRKGSHWVLSDLELYPVLFFASLLFSVPTLFIVGFLVVVFKRLHFKSKWIKLTSIAVTLIGINTTLFLVEGSMSKALMIAYSFTALSIGVFLIYRKKTELNKQSF